MNTHPAALITACSACLGAPAFAQSGGPYEITVWSIDGGGVVNASGGPYTLSGTIGQHDAGPAMDGGGFVVEGGFWPAAVLTEICSVDLAPPFGTINLFDLFAFLDLYNQQDPAADIAAPFGTINVFDLLAYLEAYNAGCS